MQKFILIFAASSALIANILGAFGAHALKSRLDEHLMAVFQTGTQYQFYHSLALLFIGLLIFFLNMTIWLQISAWAFVVGIILFSGSLYTLALTGIKPIGAVTPLGGLSFIIAWLCLVIAIAKQG